MVGKELHDIYFNLICLIVKVIQLVPIKLIAVDQGSTIRGCKANVSLSVQGCTMGLEVIVIFTRLQSDVAIDKQALSGCYL